MSGDNLNIVLFLVATTITIALAAMNAAGWRHPILIRSLFALAGVCFVIVAWLVLKFVSPAIAATINQVATHPVSWFVVLMFGLATLMRPTDGGRTSDSVSKPEISLDFVKNILISTYSPDSPALFIGTASDNFDKITLFLDYSAYITGFGISAWSQRRRIKLASFEPFEKGIRYEATIISRITNTDEKTAALRWGNDPNKDIISNDKYRARLRIYCVWQRAIFLFYVNFPLSA